MSIQSTTCPFCGENSLYPLPSANGDLYVLTTADNNYNPPRYNTSGVPVILMGCTHCKGVHIICPSLKENK
ncbi:hypothetical protein [Clostridium perfringens]|uniref:hypothetical protein n=1 Tax=Clostridium perfringens TaxID=1502 RepID=UPI0018E4ABDC|nr:hypothetical protein [Clostridium perfringens]EJT6152851.1 hypothetical protein [Clostridium perfringens]MBI6014501.1 hypothetical protein [Clostridium perfringens]MCX0382965.1 hypothetical protein [Clostridium perfringens]WEV14813.1 hypothetical protein PL325_08685 [Clostridium perfringens D]